MSKAYKGFRWIALDKFGQQFFTFIIFLVIASQLEPAEFGIYAFCMIIVNVAILLQDMGIGETIIKLPKKQDILDTCFYSNITVSVVLTLAIYFTADKLSTLYGLPEAAKYVKLISLSVFIKSFIVVQDSILKKDLDYKKLTIRSGMAKVLSSIIALVLVYLDYGVYALVFQHISFSFFSLVFIWFITDWRPSTKFNWTTFRRVFKFSLSFLKTKSLSIITTKSDVFVIGYFFGATVLGLYTVGLNLVNRIQQVINGIVLSYAYPLLSSKSRKEISVLYIRLLRHLSFFSAIIFVSFIIYNIELIELTLGNKWYDAGFYFQVISIYAFAKVISGLSAQTMKAINRIEVLFKVKLVETISKIILLVSLSFLFTAETVIGLTYLFLFFYMFLIYSYYIVKNSDLLGKDILKIYAYRVLYIIPVFIGFIYKPEFYIYSLAFGVCMALISIGIYIQMNKDLIGIVKNVVKIK